MSEFHPILSSDLKQYVEAALAEAPTDCAWAENWKSKNFAVALTNIEASMISDPKDLSPKIWWVRAQLELARVPLSALAASMSDIESQTKDLPQHGRAILSTLIALSSKLVDKGQARLGLSLLQSCANLSERDPLFTNALRRDLAEYLLTVIRAEIGKNETKRHSADYVDELRKSEVVVKRSISEIPKDKTPKTTKGKSLSAKSLLEDIEPHTQEAKKEQKPWSLGASTSAEEPVSELQNVNAQTPFERSKPVLGMLAFFGLIWATWHFVFATNPPPSSKLKLAMNTSLAVPPEPALANLPILRSDSLATKIAALDKNLEQVGERVRNLGNIIPEETSSEVAQVEVDEAALNSKEAEQLRAASIKPASEKLSPIDTSPKASLPEPNAKDAPYLDPERLARIPVDELGATRRPLDAPALRDLRVGPDGRVFGPPADVNNNTRDSGLRGPDGKAVQSYAVEEFPQPVKYRTIVPVQVLSAPSQRAIPVSRLERDATVHVVARMGPWLELRSTGGRSGYMYAQDAVIAE